ncbi:hypothetical protein JKP88DRAFT_218295 [Tribonema minus]|uniref:Uncharacterized protein n=1 Tax=Tribonema minus TaxID=303371 RepID=A0A835Z8F4_9STRA|nr:hypothetical protein JKP88DRAFT_218295 [Tribonema minus]
MFRATAAAALRATHVARATTGSWNQTFSGSLTGDKGSARKQLTELQRQLLQRVERIPAQAAYRKEVEAVAQHKLKILENPDLSDEQVEQEISGGQLEDLIGQGRDELGFIQFYEDERKFEQRPYSTYEETLKGPRQNPWEW